MEHPLISAARAALRNAEEAAAKLPFPYAPGTPVELVTPTGSRYRGEVLHCDERYLCVRSVAFAIAIRADTDRLWFHAHTSPEGIRHGVLIMQTANRTSPELATGLATL